MNHKRYKKLIVLSLYDELTVREKEQLDRHLAACHECRSEIASLKGLHHVLGQVAPAVEPEQMLEAARRQFREALRNDEQPGESWQEKLIALIWPNGKLVLGGAIAAALGVAIGFILFHPAERALPVHPAVISSATGSESDIRISNVRFLQSNPATGDVDFVFDAVKSVHLQGNIEDMQIQKVLTHAMLNEENPGVRLKSVSAMASRPSADAQVKRALIAALKDDKNAAVRLEALRGLSAYQYDQEIQSTLLFTLMHDQNPGLRIAAINQLDSASVSGRTIGKDALKVLRDKMQHDDNNYIRLRAKAVVQEISQ
ncbi:MAG TPA: HEAT repeat domain-containing protein [Bacteroidota bacterium]|nr:HEAT repeat domain-containing protein [Bacteroidota bacterium]